MARGDSFALRTSRPIKLENRDRALRIAASGLTKMRYGAALHQAVRDTLSGWSLDPNTIDDAFVRDALVVAIADQRALVRDFAIRLDRETELLDLLEAAATEELPEAAA
jgi:hypothetical protein